MSYLIISSSLNPKSKSKILATELLQSIVKANFIDLKDYPLPLCDGGASYDHPNVKLLATEIKNSQVIILTTPIYNYDVNAAVKNLIELTGSAWDNKTVAFLCAAGGQNSYMSVMALANSLMLDFRCLIVPRFVYASAADFQDDELTSAEVRSRIAKLATEISFLHDRLS
jgi:FMN reductase